MVKGITGISQSWWEINTSGSALSVLSFAGMKGDNASMEPFIFSYNAGSYSLLYNMTSLKRVDVRWVTTGRPLIQCSGTVILEASFFINLTSAVICSSSSAFWRVVRASYFPHAPMQFRKLQGSISAEDGSTDNLEDRGTVTLVCHIRQVCHTKSISFSTIKSAEIVLPSSRRPLILKLRFCHPQVWMGCVASSVTQ